MLHNSNKVRLQAQSDVSSEHLQLLVPLSFGVRLFGLFLAAFCSLLYLALLTGLGWLLSEMDTYEADKAWVKRYRELSDLVRMHGAISTYLPSELHEWLNRQRGLQRMGMLGNDRVHMLNELGMDWDFRKSEDDLLWEERLVELLEFKRVNPSSKVGSSLKTRPVVFWAMLESFDDTCLKRIQIGRLCFVHWAMKPCLCVIVGVSNMDELDAT